MSVGNDYDGSGYFLYHSIGMFPGKAERIRAALADLGSLWGTPHDAQWEQSLRLRSQFLGRWRALIGAPAGTMTTAENVTTALYSIVGSLPNRYLEGRKLLIAADCFPSLHFLLSGMAERRGFVVDTVPMRPGEAWVRDEDFMAALGIGRRCRAADLGDFHRLASLRSARTRRAWPPARFAGGRRYHTRRRHRAVRRVSRERGLPGCIDAQVAVRRRGRRRAAGSRDISCRSARPSCAAGSARRILSPGRSIRSRMRPTRAGSITGHRRFLRPRRVCPLSNGTRRRNPRRSRLTTADCARRRWKVVPGSASS